MPPCNFSAKKEDKLYAKVFMWRLKQDNDWVENCSEALPWESIHHQI